MVPRPDAFFSTSLARCRCYAILVRARTNLPREPITTLTASDRFDQPHHKSRKHERGAGALRVVLSKLVYCSTRAHPCNADESRQFFGGVCSCQQNTPLPCQPYPAFTRHQQHPLRVIMRGAICIHRRCRSTSTPPRVAVRSSCAISTRNTSIQQFLLANATPTHAY